MATSIYLVGSDGSTTIHLVNSNGGLPTPGGDPSSASTTPFGIRAGWALKRAGRLDSYIDETIPLVYIGTSTDGALDAMTLLTNLVDDPMTGQAALVIQPSGASSPESYGIYFIDSVQEAPFDGTQRSPSEGALQFFVDITIRRTAQPGVTIFEELLG